MGRAILAVIAGAIVMGITVFIIETIGHTLYPPPAGTDLSDPEAVRTLMDSLPAMALVFVMLAWAAGSFTGAWVAARLARTHRRGAALSIGVIMIILVAISASMIPHPAWMLAISVVVPIPLALAALRVARR